MRLTEDDIVSTINKLQVIANYINDSRNKDKPKRYNDLLTKADLQIEKATITLSDLQTEMNQGVI